jgi:hypothetical protein
MQVGILSLSQLQLHDHYNLNSGGPINLISRTDSANARLNSGGSMTVAGVGVWGLMARILIQEDSPGAGGGGMNINYTLTRAGGAGTVHAQARIYRAGALIWNGVDNSTAAGPTVYNDPTIVLNLLAQDVIDVWGYVSAGATTICDVSAVEVCYDATLVQLSRRVLTVPLALTGTGLLYEVIL